MPVHLVIIVSAFFISGTATSTIFAPAPMNHPLCTITNPLIISAASLHMLRTVLAPLHSAPHLVPLHHLWASARSLTSQRLAPLSHGGWLHHFTEAVSVSSRKLALSPHRDNSQCCTSPDLLHLFTSPRPLHTNHLTEAGAVTSRRLALSPHGGWLYLLMDPGSV